MPRDFGVISRPLIEPLLELGETLRGVAAAVHQKSFSGQLYARGVTERRLIHKVSEHARLGFDLAVTRGGQSSVSTRRLGVGSGKELAKLRGGAYLLALRPGTWDAARSLPALDGAAWRQLASLVVTIDHE